MLRDANYVLDDFQIDIFYVLDEIFQIPKFDLFHFSLTLSFLWPFADVHKHD